MRQLAMFIMCSIGFASAAQAADMSACALPDPAKTVALVAQLPADVREALLSNGPVSDPDGPFNASDVVIESAQPVPRRRLVSGQAGVDLICLRLEKGGLGVCAADKI